MFSKKHLYAYKLVQEAFPSTLVQDHSTSDDDSSDSEADDEDYGTNNQNKQKLIKVTGLEEAVDAILAADDTPVYCVYKHRVPVFLLHLGNQDLCMLWHSCGVQGSGGINVNCAVFHIQEKPDGSFHAHVHRIDHHPLRDVLHMNDCFTLKQSRQHSSASPDSVLKVEQAMSRIHVMSQASRHARRLYVGGLPSETSKEAIVELFNCKVKGSFHSGVVHDVHVNQEESYAIVEFFSVEEASQAMKLGTIYLEGAQLVIRRPNDYNARLDAYHVPDLPSKPHYPHTSCVSILKPQKSTKGFKGHTEKMVFWKVTLTPLKNHIARASSATRPSQLIPASFRQFCSSKPSGKRFPRIFSKELRLREGSSEGKVLYPDMVDIEKVGMFFERFKLKCLKNGAKRINAVYYGVSVVTHGNKNTVEEEVEMLNKEVAFKDAVRKVIFKVFTGVEKCPLGEEPTVKWILEDRIESEDEMAWDVVVSVDCINGITKEEMVMISQKVIKKLAWIVITNTEGGDLQLQGFNLCQGSFICSVVPRSFFGIQSDYPVGCTLFWEPYKP